MRHPYLRSIGFSGYNDRKSIRKLINDIVARPENRFVFTNTANESPDPVNICRCIGISGKNTGIAVFGELDEDDNKFRFNYYFPFLVSEDVSTSEEISVEKLTHQDAYEGIVDEARVGVSLIFYVNNMLDYMRMERLREHPLKGATLALSALAESGTVIMPIMKTGKERDYTRKKANNRYRLISAAKRGNESAIEKLTLEDMDTYTAVSKKIHGSDVFSLVDTYFMPYGVECDHYSVLGEIVTCRRQENTITGESIYVMKLLCNDMYFDVCINAWDLTGEPRAGRRFKGNVWLQGRILFSNEDIFPSKNPL